MEKKFDNSRVMREAQLFAWFKVISFELLILQSLLLRIVLNSINAT